MLLEDFSVNIHTIAQDHNATIHEWDLGNIDGCIVKHHGYHIAVNYKINPYNKAFAIAHEIGHIKDRSVGGVRTLIAERRANDIATDILIPDDRFMEAVEECGGAYEYLCPLFGVSPEIVERKMRKLITK